MFFLLLGGCSGRDTISPTLLPVPTIISPTIPPAAIPPTIAPTSAPAGGGQFITFESSDGVTLYGTLYGNGPVAVIFSTMNGVTQETWAAAADYLAFTLARLMPLTKNDWALC